MAKVKSKGTVLKQDIAATLTAVAQIIEVGHDGAESETYESTTLDTSGAGKEYSQTGYSEGGSVDFSIFLDPALAGHQSLMDDVTTPAERDYEITFADTGATASAFTAAGIGFGFTAAMNDGLKADVSLKLNQLMTYPT